MGRTVRSHHDDEDIQLSHKKYKRKKKYKKDLKVINLESIDDKFEDLDEEFDDEFESFEKIRKGK